MKPPSTLHLWTTQSPFHHEDDHHDSSEDEEEDKTPRAVKAKESPLPSISSSWEASPPLRGLHHRILQSHRTTVADAFRAYSSSDNNLPHNVLPRTVHSPYRAALSSRRKSARFPHHKATIFSNRQVVFISLGMLVLACWMVAAILYAHLPSSWWQNDYTNKQQAAASSLLMDAPSATFAMHRRVVVERSPMRHFRPTQPTTSHTQRVRDSRRHKVQPHRMPKMPLALDWSRAPNDDDDNQKPVRTTASLEALCGGYAVEMALLEHPEYFPAERALDDSSRVVWIGPQWDLLQYLMATCPRMQLAQVARPLPDDDVLARIRLLRQYPSLVFDAESSNDDNPVRFVETLPLGLQTRQTNQQIDVVNATHVVWVLNDYDKEDKKERRSLLTQVLEIKQMLLDLQSARHIVVVADNKNTPDWKQALVRAAANVDVTWIASREALVPALQMRHPSASFWHLNDTVRHELLPAAAPSAVLADHAPRLPCTSSCAAQQACQASVWDETAAMTRILTQECTVVVYTAAGSATVSDLAATEYKQDETSEELVCNVAFVAQDSSLVQSSIQRIPNPDLVRLGVEPHPGDDANAIHQRKLENLNGKLLYKGWILVWTNTTWDDNSLLATNPGRFWSDDVRYALYCDGTSAPSWQDVKFLLHQMHRPAWPARNAKKAQMHYRLPAEPQRQAVVLLTERPFRDKKKTHTLRKALSRWGRDEVDSSALQRQAKLYDQFDVWINRQRYQRRYYKPQNPLPYHYQLTHWTSTQWILHDLKSLDGADLRCQWYKEVFHSKGSPALALAHALALQEMERRIKFGEPDDHTIQHTWARRMAFKEALTDTQEWIPLAVEANRPFASSAYRLDTTMTLSQYVPDVGYQNPDQTPVYVRIMSDRVVAAARRAYHG